MPRRTQIGLSQMLLRAGVGQQHHRQAVRDAPMGHQHLPHRRRETGMERGSGGGDNSLPAALGLQCQAPRFRQTISLLPWLGCLHISEIWCF